MSAWSAFLLSAAIKTTLVIVAAWILAFAMRRQSAAARHLVWTAAAVALLALPLLSVSMPAWRVRSAAFAPLVSPVTFRASTVAAVDATPPPALSIPASPRPASRPTRLDLAFLIPLLWGAGAALSLAHMAAAWMLLSHKRRMATPIEDGALFPALTRTLGIRRKVALLEIPAGGMPLSFGVLRPAVFLPTDARQWSDVRRRIVLLHELAHIRRSDLATQIVTRAALSLYWWNPLAWMVWREFVKERERAADDLVLTAGEAATEYASQLIEIARSLQAAPALASAAVAMARPSQLEGRLMAILDARINRRALSPRAPLAAAVLAVALVAPFAALQAQDKPDAVIEPDIQATIQAAIAQQNHDILDAAAAAYASSRKYDAAQNLLQNALTIRAKTSGDRSSAYAIGLMKLGDLSVRRGKTADAVDFYTRAVALGDTPDTVPGLIYLATHALAAKDPIAAEKFVDRALLAAPSGKQATRALIVKGNIALFNDLTGVAEMSYQQALAQAPPDSPDAALAMETYAKFLLGEGRDGESEAQLAAARLIRQEAVAAIGSQGPPIVTTDARAYSFRVAVPPGVRPAPSPAPKGAPQPPFKVGNGVIAPVLLSKMEPEYSPEALSAKYTGTVILKLVVGTDGTASDLQLIKSLGFGLDEKAAEAVMQWHFGPARKDGIAVPVQATVEVNFRLL